VLIACTTLASLSALFESPDYLLAVPSKGEPQIGDRLGFYFKTIPGHLLNLTLHIGDQLTV
jgi:hypothetical protein